MRVEVSGKRGVSRQLNAEVGNGLLRHFSFCECFLVNFVDAILAHQALEQRSAANDLRPEMAHCRPILAP